VDQIHPGHGRLGVEFLPPHLLNGLQLGVSEPQAECRSRDDKHLSNKLSNKRIETPLKSEACFGPILILPANRLRLT
jgi:hypothetical protein